MTLKYPYNVSVYCYYILNGLQHKYLYQVGRRKPHQIKQDIDQSIKQFYWSNKFSEIISRWRKMSRPKLQTDIMTNKITVGTLSIEGCTATLFSYETYGLSQVVF